MSYLVKSLEASPARLSQAQQTQVIQAHYEYVCKEIASFIKGKRSARGLIINGPKGGGKTSLVVHTVKELRHACHVINGTITAPVLWEHLYTHARNPNQTLIIDDTDVVFNDIEMSDILKAALDGQGKTINYGKANSAYLRERAIPTEFKCMGRVIFISNMNMDPEALHKRHRATLVPIKDRCEYLKVGVSTQWNAVAMWVFYQHNMISALEASTLTASQKRDLMLFVVEHAWSDDRWTFRTIQKAISRVQQGGRWRDHVLLGL